jgi:hypothetical protein
MSKVCDRPSWPGLVGCSDSDLGYIMFRGCWRIDVVRMGRFMVWGLPDRGFSVSGGGVGGKTVLFIAGGALCSRTTLLDRFRWTRFVAA